MSTANNVTIRKLSRNAGDGGHVSYDVDVRAHDGSVLHFTFNGSIFGGSVLLTIRSQDGEWSREAIDDPRRFGEFTSPDWVNRYLDTRASAAKAYLSD
jgi:hypothetical protein